MPLNKSKGNMYTWVDATWSGGIKGECPHDCSYCYMKRWGKQRPLHFDEAELKTDLGSGNTIFVGSSCDMWAQRIPREWIGRVLDCCLHFRNRYLFQSKNPERFHDGFYFPYGNTILGTTIESNRCCCDRTSSAPCTDKRYLAMKEITLPKMISIEPIMNFDLVVMLHWMQDIKPQFVSIGADSRGCHLPEPSAEKVKALVAGLRDLGIETKLKSNLRRLVKES